MRTGVYKKKLIDWKPYEVDVFSPHLFVSNYDGCGANALALLTGIPPHFICNTNRQEPNNWKDTFMIKFLKDAGFKIREITKCAISGSSTDSVYSPDGITDKHVILYSQLFGRNVASWSVLHNKLWYHNFQTCSFTGLTNMNCPTLSCYAVCHPDWKKENWFAQQINKHFNRKTK